MVEIVSGRFTVRHILWPLTDEHWYFWGQVHQMAAGMGRMPTWRYLLGYQLQIMHVHTDMDKCESDTD